MSLTLVPGRPDGGAPAPGPVPATRGETPGVPPVATLSCHFVTEAPAFSVVADVAIVQGETPAADRTWLSFPHGTARREAARVGRGLPHLVVESVFGLDEGLWGSLATRPARGLRLVTDAACDDHAV